MSNLTWMPAGRITKGSGPHVAVNGTPRTQSSSAVEETDAWNLKISGNSAKFNTIVPNLLSCTIRESLDRFDCWGMAQAFWKSISKCHHSAPKLDTLFKDNEFDLSSIKQIAGEVFTHLYVPSPETIPEPVENTMNDILVEYATFDPWGHRRQGLLERLNYFRDGGNCPLMGFTFKSFENFLLLSSSTLCHIIPKYIGSNNGQKIAEINSRGNGINLYTSIAMTFDELQFGIETVQKDDKSSTTFVLKRHPFSVEPNGRIPFGASPYGEKLGGGPNAKLCSLHWAILRVMHTSGVAAIFEKERDEQFI
ncbi:hypothetical protein DFS33DRAFT_1457396 [Desarmillaria ectypa]|nr:hypothetical protein DFS33DRAFT_1457396 [Desarmillaria ectypa]